MTKKLQELYDDMRLSQETGRARPMGSTEDPFVLQLVQLILSHGLQLKASDIHIEPTASGARIRYRIDGILHDMLHLPPEVRDPLLRAVKIKANMANDIVGRSKPQDGRIDFFSDSKKLDLRLSSFPTLFGDVLAIRILDRSAPIRELGQLGFPPEMLKSYQTLIKRPNGLLLVTGPAGSGKTTTLYASINTLRSPHIKIITLEDPVEYQVDGIDQGQINPALGLTFASGLRAILRQDANVILVGEIRDSETADIAIRAALTGHLVLSTMHTRHSLGATTRLMDMGIEPHLIVNSISGIVAQRLIRVLCDTCRVPDPLAAQTYQRLWTQEAGGAPPAGEPAQFSKGQGCAACNGTGYQGRMGIFELLVLADELKQLVLERAAGQLYRSARNSGKLRPMLLDGLQKASRGITTVEEVLRVTGESEDL